MMSGNDADVLWLKERFEKAGVPLRLAPRPFVRGGRARVDPDAMLMDIRHVPRSAPPGEAVFLWPGKARLEVRAIDRHLRQLVLDVEERERTLWLRNRWFLNRWDELRVPADARSFLIGMDECHLFMARLPGRATSVANARDLLAPRMVGRARRSGVRVMRQGEHFFLPATGTEIEALRDLLQRGIAPRPGPVRPQREGMALVRPGKPHHADETLMIAGVQYVRGTIRHPDHHPLRLHEWARPELNTEHRGPIVRGVTWVD